MYPRHSETLLKELLKEFRILYLTGPRQAGKTTLARQIANDFQHSIANNWHKH
jgi:predicted AAA+ superfamily ATPase